MTGAAAATLAALFSGNPEDMLSAAADGAFAEGLGEDPFDFEVSCRSAPSVSRPDEANPSPAIPGLSAADPALCKAARRNGSLHAAD